MGACFVLFVCCGATLRCQSTLFPWFGFLWFGWRSAELRSSRCSRKAEVGHSEHLLGFQFGLALECPLVVSHAGLTSACQGSSLFSIGLRAGCPKYGGPRWGHPFQLVRQGGDLGGMAFQARRGRGAPPNHQKLYKIDKTLVFITLLPANLEKSCLALVWGVCRSIFTDT